MKTFVKPGLMVLSLCGTVLLASAIDHPSYARGGVGNAAGYNGQSYNAAGFNGAGLQGSPYNGSTLQGSGYNASNWNGPGMQGTSAQGAASINAGYGRVISIELPAQAISEKNMPAAP